MRTSLVEFNWSQNFDEKIRCLNVNETWAIKEDKILELYDEFAPTYTIGNKSKWQYTFPVSTNLREMINKDESS